MTSSLCIMAAISGPEGFVLELAKKQLSGGLNFDTLSIKLVLRIGCFSQLTL